MQTSTPSNDNGASRITRFHVFALGRSGRRVHIKYGVTFGVEVAWTNGVVSELQERFPSFLVAACFGGRALDTAKAAGMVA